MNSKRNSLLFILVSALVIHASGCSLFATRDAKESAFNTEAAKALGYTLGSNGFEQAMPTAGDQPYVYLEVINKKQHLERIPMPVDKPMFIDDILQEAKLPQRLGRIDVVILRPTGPNRPPVRMEVDMDQRSGSVAHGQNYSLRPGDKVIVSKNRESALDRMMSSVMPISRAAKR